MKLKTLSVSMFIIILLSVAPGYCGWVDDWITQKTVSNPASFESQKRGFATAGGASMRWKQSRDYLVTASPPKFSSGCGGIDLFGGGFNFLKYEMLVEKLQRIMGPAAATFAFDIAMNTLCEPCAKGIKSLEAITDRLNQLQIDDCSAQKATVAIMKDPSAMMNPMETEAVSNFLVTSGMHNLYTDVVDAGKEATTSHVMNEQGASKPDLVAGCPTEIKNIFFTPGSLLNNLATEKGVAVGYISLIRALVGDVEISSNLDYNYLTPCEENSPENVSGFVYGDLYIRDLMSNDCDPITVITINGTSYASIASYIRSELEVVAQAMLDRSVLLPPQEAFLQTIPAPIYMAMKTDIQAWGESATAANVAGSYVDFASAAYAVAMFNDLYTTIETVLSTAEILVKNKKGTDTGNDQNTCKDQLKDGPFHTLIEMRHTVAKYKVAIGENYNRKVEVFLANIQMGSAILTTEKDIHSRKTKQFKREMK